MKMQVSSLSHLALGEILSGLSPKNSCPQSVWNVTVVGAGASLRPYSFTPQALSQERTRMYNGLVKGESNTIFPVNVMAVSKEAEASSVVAKSPLVAW
jgi:hypothetical protein